ncbi:MAG: hypothetical protein Ta2B_17950 [Termitinemataceae bacterium]|nr:MAG: hypothetical protein Ta2B_17950 [Termitinemataceae bacterium]
MSKTIFDILESSIDIDREIKTIWDLFNSCTITVVDPYKLSDKEKYTQYTICEYVNKYSFSDWKMRNTCISCEDMAERLGIKNIIPAKECKSEEKIIIRLEYIVNVVSRCIYAVKKESKHEHSQEFDILYDNTQKLIEQLSYTIIQIEENEKYILVKKNAFAEYAASIVDDQNAKKILNYNHYSYKGNTEEKRSVLLSLSNIIEHREEELIRIDRKIRNNLFFLLNNLNIRHNNEDQIKVLSSNELENWYDDTYRLELLSLALLDNVERNGRIVDLKKIMKAQEQQT